MHRPYLISALAALAIAGLIPATAAADRPTTEEFSPVGDQFVCGDTLLTVTSGTVLERQHVQELDSGLSHVVLIETPSDVILTGEEGTEYRLVGTARGNFITAADPEDEFLLQQGFFHFKVNLMGEEGLFGTVDFLLRRTDSEETIQDRGSCHFA